MTAPCCWSLQVGPDFTADLAAGRTAQLQVLIDGRNSNNAQIALNDVNQIVNQFNSDWIAAQGLQGAPVSLVTRAWYNPNLESRWFFVTGLVGLLTMVVTMMVTSLSVAREREQGTFDQLLVTPLRPVEILIGKAMPGVVIGVFEASLVALWRFIGSGSPSRGPCGSCTWGLCSSSWRRSGWGS